MGSVHGSAHEEALAVHVRRNLPFTPRGDTAALSFRALCIAVFICVLAAPTMSLAAPLTVTAKDVAPHLQGAVDVNSLRSALSRAIDEALLKDEATRHLPANIAQSPQGPRTLLNTLFSPNELCKRFPERARRALFESARWRLQMPKAWRVSAINWRCCSGKACEHPDVAPCRVEGRESMTRLRQELPDTLSDVDFGAFFDARRPEQARLGFERYTFFHEPKSSARPAHRRLRRAAKPIVEAVTAARPGAVIGPIPTRQGYTLVRLRGTRPGVHLTWDDPRTQALLRTELCPARVAQARRQYLSDLRRQLPIVIDHEGIEAAWGITLTPAPPQ